MGKNMGRGMRSSSDLAGGDGSAQVAISRERPHSTGTTSSLAERRKMEVQAIAKEAVDSGEGRKTRPKAEGRKW